MSRLILFLFLIIGLTSCKSSWIVGQWEGLGQETDGATWAINFEAESHKKVNISYPSVPVEANWYYSFTRSGQMVYYELAEYENGDDLFAVLITRISEDILEIRYYKRQSNPQDTFSEENLMAKGMVKRLDGINKGGKKINSSDFVYTPPQPLKLKKAAKYKFEK